MVGVAEVEVIPAWFSILPPLTAILVALLMERFTPRARFVAGSVGA